MQKCKCNGSVVVFVIQQTNQSKNMDSFACQKRFSKIQKKEKQTKISSFSLYVQVEMVQIAADSNRPLLTELLISLHAVTCNMIPSREWAIIVPSNKTFPENTWKCISGKVQYPMH